MRFCWRCERDLPVREFVGLVSVCRSCFAGRARFSALARQRPHLQQLRGPARDCFIAWETGRLAFSRALAPFGIRVWWRGFDPVVTVVPRPVEPPDGW